MTGWNEAKAPEGSFAEDFKENVRRMYRETAGYNDDLRRSQPQIVQMAPALFEEYGGDLGELDCEPCKMKWRECPCEIVTLIRQ